MDYNNITVIGNLTRDPIHKVTEGGTEITNFSVANNLNKESVQFLDCTAFGKTAIAIADYAKKGSKLLVSGRLELGEYESKDGTTKKSVKIIVGQISFLSSNKKESTDNQVADSPAVDENGIPF
jgi:single-strand DNA-binding protein